jgi:hypothetical protein
MKGVRVRAIDRGVGWVMMGVIADETGSDEIGKID